jgi:hypothetical protein
MAPGVLRKLFEGIKNGLSTVGDLVRGGVSGGGELLKQGMDFARENPEVIRQGIDMFLPPPRPQGPPPSQIYSSDPRQQQSQQRSIQIPPITFDEPVQPSRRGSRKRPTLRD